MATNPIGEGKTVVSASVPIALANEIARRAKRLKWTKSKYASELLQKWYDDGCAPVNEIEAAALAQKLERELEGSDPSPDEIVLEREAARRAAGKRQEKTS